MLHSRYGCAPARSQISLGKVGPSGSVNDRAVGCEHGSVARAVPRALGVVPGHGAALMRTNRGEEVEIPLIVSAHGDLLLAPDDDAALASLDFIHAAHDRLRVAVLVKVLGKGAGWIIELLPSG